MTERERRVGVKGLGEGVAFAGLCASAAWLEVAGGDVFWLWVVVLVWTFGSDWGQKDK